MTCVTIVSIDLGRYDRRYIDWPIGGQGSSATAAVQIENDGVWRLATIADGYVTAMFAGALYVDPAPATVITGPSHVVIRIIDGDETTLHDGGVIRPV